MSKNYAMELSARFAGCKMIATARDETKNRDVRLYALSDSFDVVGVYDGTDCWIAPSATNPFNVNVRDQLCELWKRWYLEGAPYETEKTARKVRRVPI